MLGLLQGRIWLQDDSVHSASQRVVTSLGERVHNRGWSHCMLLLLLPRLCHPSTSHTRIQHSADDLGFSAKLRGGGGYGFGEVTTTQRVVECCICVYTRPLRQVRKPEGKKHKQHLTKQTSNT